MNTQSDKCKKQCATCARRLVCPAMLRINELALSENPPDLDPPLVEKIGKNPPTAGGVKLAEECLFKKPVSS